MSEPGTDDPKPMQRQEQAVGVPPRSTSASPWGSTGEPAVTASPRFAGPVDDSDALTRLHPNYKLLMRLGALFAGLFILVLGIVADGAMQAAEFAVPFGIVSGIALLLALFIIIRVPNRRYHTRGYQVSSDRLRVVRGYLWRSDTIVPFGRVQHIDVDQGPIERALGIATMTLHTAGSHNASIRLPGLGHELAIAMREEIRSHIKREAL
jgi:membrane protein YdbS with pleckstrin-like domain